MQIVKSFKVNLPNNGIMNMCREHKFGGLFEDPERLEKYQKLFEEAFPGQTALDILHRTPAKHAKK
ncbi:MAG: hypothetical protein OIN88_14330 [Candidatus Methanoperedens sp.]|nr:hypothetical protein [Candidatus Methanoperedens sp.]